MNKMKAALSVIIAIVMIMSISPLSFASNVGTTYYVDSVNGDDGNSGTSADSAWKTVEKASSVEYSAGDKILFKAGDSFVGQFDAKGSGTEENPITLGAYGDVEKLGKPALTVNDDKAVIRIVDLSYWTIDGLDISAPNGMGIFVSCEKSEMRGITIENCSIHDIFQCRVESQAVFWHASIAIWTIGAGHLRDVTIRNIDIKDCGYGIYITGNSAENANGYFVSPEESYLKNLLCENLSINNVFYDGIIISSVYNSTVRNCKIINASLYDDFATAPIWMSHSKKVTVEHCEIAGSTNTKDGMAIDFDGWVTDSTVQYVYSHDNVRFMQNCVYDDETQNRNNTVRYCLSVNDNKALNNAAQLLGGKNATVGMTNFKFYNNTIIDGGDYDFSNLVDATIANNVFISSKAVGKIQVTRKNSIAGVHKFDGVMTNNCFINYTIPMAAKNNTMAYAGFVGGDLYDINSYILSASSPLIGKGIQVEENMGEQDYYGNPLGNTHNIGCFDSQGIDDGKKIDPFVKIKAVLAPILFKFFGAVHYLFDRL